MSDLTIVIRLPQPFGKCVRVLEALAAEWPDVVMVGDRVDIPSTADEVDEGQVP